MKGSRFLAVAMAACMITSMSSSIFSNDKQNSEVVADAAASEAKLPTRAKSYLSDFNLEGFVADVLSDNVQNWQLKALTDNPNILEEIERAASGDVMFGTLFGDPFRMNNHSEIKMDTAGHGLSGNAIDYHFTKTVGNEGFADRDVGISKDPTVNTDVVGAEELWVYVNAKEMPEAVDFRLAFEEGDKDTGVRESWMPKTGIEAYLIPDGDTARTTINTVSDGFVRLPVDFSGWVCYNLDEDHFVKYWDGAGGASNRVIDYVDMHQFQFNVKVSGDYVGKSVYLDAFSVVGSDLAMKEGVMSLPVEIESLANKEFRQLWSVDNLVDKEINSDGNIMPWYGEFIGKLLTGLVFNYQLNNSPELRAEIIRIVDGLEAAQGEDGYLGTYATNRFGMGWDTWDMWNHYHICYGLYNWYLVSGEQRAVDMACRALDYMIEYLKENNNGNYRPTYGWEMNLAISHIFAIMYGVTENQTYLDVCEHMLNVDWSTPGGSNWYKDALSGKDFFQSELHRWESLHPIMMLSTLYEITGNTEYFKAYERVWKSIQRTDRHNTGAFSSGEGAKGTPYLSGAGAEIETCCTISWMALTSEYLQMSKNMQAADELELSYFNAMLGSLIGGDRDDETKNKYVTYNTPMEGHYTPGNYDGRKLDAQTDIGFQYNVGSPDFNCCQANAARGLGELSQWGVLTEKGAMYVNYYGASEANTRTPEGKAISLKQTTEYPKNGSIKLEVSSLAQAERFTLNLRIPTWSKQALVKVNGEPVQTAKSGEYFAIERDWKQGDTVWIELDMGVHFWQGESTFEGRVSAYYGPILLALDEKVTPDNTVANTRFNASDFENVIVTDARADDHWMYFDVKDVNGRTVRLVDFATCGQYVDGEPGDYSTWLKIDSEDLPVLVVGDGAPVAWDNMLPHSITVNSAEVSVSAASAKAGEEVSFGVAYGKEIESITITTKMGEVLYEANDGGYGFIMPASDVTVTVTFKSGDDGGKESGCGSVLGVTGLWATAALIGVGSVLVRRKKSEKDE